MNRKLQLLAVASLVTLGMVGCSGGTPSAPSQNTGATEEATTAPEPAAAPEWVEVATLSGNADQQSDTIVFGGGKVRVTYDFVDNTGANMIVGAIYVLAEGTDIMVDGGIPEVMITEASAGETIVRKAAGEYYLKVTSANADYTVKVEEQK